MQQQLAWMCAFHPLPKHTPMPLRIIGAQGELLVDCAQQGFDADADTQPRLDRLELLLEILAQAGRQRRNATESDVSEMVVAVNLEHKPPCLLRLRAQRRPLAACLRLYSLLHSLLQEPLHLHCRVAIVAGRRAPAAKLRDAHVVGIGDIVGDAEEELLVHVAQARQLPPPANDLLQERGHLLLG
eukprot:6212053-Pleurochrysis_carterae.AAC.1